MKKRVTKKIQWCLEWNKRQNQRIKQWWVWLRKRLHENLNSIKLNYIKFNSDDNLPLNKLLKFYNMTIIIRSVFVEDGKLYPQLFLDDTLHELNI